MTSFGLGLARLCDDESDWLIPLAKYVPDDFWGCNEMYDLPSCFHLHRCDSIRQSITGRSSVVEPVIGVVATLWALYTVRPGIHVHSVRICMRACMCEKANMW